MKQPELMQLLAEADSHTGPLVKRLLITNDDGYDAPGIQLLLELAGQLAEEVWLVAPETDQSGSSQSLSLHQPIRCKQLAERQFAVRGTPSDCVLMGAFQLMPEPPDLLLSGINLGINMADTVGFSGTLGAATTASLFGIPAIALSQAWKDRNNIHWDTSGRYAVPLIRQLLSQPLPEGLVTNINFPSVAAAAVAGISNASINGRSLTGAGVEQRQDQRQQDYYWLSFQHNYRQVQQPDSDVNALRQQSIAISFLERPLTAGINPQLFERFG
ncbi:5'/3'-nucleotidase SurE [Oceanobacter mangrovi]|uniref:5'/3'-nucleotidase SurE n=1 Tax=Oceanobacter mangrovi TaxID=2862510 RepID=UPI001C8EBF9D|nr:5'/3'-nucleotidase SurE [Oceanobacter mangrovi]